MGNNNIKRILSISLLLISITCNAQNVFTERLKAYYDSNTPKNDSLYRVIMQDTVIKNNGNCKELLQFTEANDLFYKDTFVSVYLIYKMSSDSRKFIGLSDSDKNRLLTFFSTILLDSLYQNYYFEISNCLFIGEFWYNGKYNDNIQYNSVVKSNLKQIIKDRTKYLIPSVARLFSGCYLDELLPDIVEYAVKPYFENNV